TRAARMEDLAIGIYNRWNAHEQAGTFNGLNAERIENTFVGAAKAANNFVNNIPNAFVDLAYSLTGNPFGRRASNGASA
ncbi:MAG: hypothetical protein QXD77_03075, partial [Candidatus Aenigmatarchaeota archaeon]